MNRLLAATGGFTVLLACVALFLWSKGGRTAKDERAPTHAHCPECGLEIAYIPALAEKPCPHCGPQSGRMIATFGPANTPGSENVGVSTGGKVVAFIVVGLVVAQGLVYGWVLFQRHNRQRETEVQKRLLICYCPFCKRKIGYPATKIGAGIKCSRCKTAFPLPADGVPEEV